MKTLALAAVLGAWLYPLTQTRVIDGDSMEVTLQLRPGLHETVKVRLPCSAPELREDGGLEAKARLSAFVDGGVALRTDWRREKYGRTLADVVRGDAGFCEGQP